MWFQCLNETQPFPLKARGGHCCNDIVSSVQEPKKKFQTEKQSGREHKCSCSTADSTQFSQRLYFPSSVPLWFVPLAPEWFNSPPVCIMIYRDECSMLCVFISCPTLPALPKHRKIIFTGRTICKYHAGHHNFPNITWACGQAAGPQPAQHSALSFPHTFGWAPWWREKTWRKWSSTWGPPASSMSSITGRSLRCCGGPPTLWTRRKTFTRPRWWKSATPSRWSTPETPAVSTTASRYDSSTLGWIVLFVCWRACDVSTHTAHTAWSLSPQIVFKVPWEISCASVERPWRHTTSDRNAFKPC